MALRSIPCPRSFGSAKVALRDVPIKLVERHQMKELVFHLDEMARPEIGPNGRSFKAKTACRCGRSRRRLPRSCGVRDQLKHAPT
jgi:hypothetical protein